MSTEAKKIMNQVRLFPVSVAFKALSVALCALSSAAMPLDESTMIAVELCTEKYPALRKVAYRPVLFAQSCIAGLAEMTIPIVALKTPNVVSWSVSFPFQCSVPSSSVLHQRKFNSVEDVTDEVGRALSGITVSNPTVQPPLAKVEIGTSTIIVKFVLSAISSPTSVKFTFTGSVEVNGTDGGSQNCMIEESTAGGAGLLGGGALLNEEVKSGFVFNAIERKTPDISHKITADARIIVRLRVVSLSYCRVLKYSSRTARTASGMVSSFLALRSVSSALSMSSDTEIIIFFIAIFKSPIPFC
jgi:hypothetical protein